MLLFVRVIKLYCYVIFRLFYFNNDNTIDEDLFLKVLNKMTLVSNQWNGNDWPEINQIIELSNNQDVTIKMNPGFYIGYKNGDDLSGKMFPTLFSSK